MNQKRLPSHPFWEFSLSVYSEDSVKKACLDLQDRHDLNVNIILFCCWIAASSRGRLNQEDLSQALFAIRQWHDGITLGLRQIRNHLSDFGLPIWAKELRKDVLNSEIAAEQVEQLLLAKTIKRPVLEVRATLQKAMDAVSNVSSYAKLQGLKLEVCDLRSIHQIMSSVFPQISTNELFDLCQPTSPTLTYPI